MPFELRSAAFAEGGAIPGDHTCDGHDLSPPFQWSGTPPGTRAFALICTDPDAPHGTFHHWAIYDIPGNRSSLAAGECDLGESLNDFGRRGYGGPCPPRGAGPHRYVFRLSALRRAIGPRGPRARASEIERLARRLELGAAELTGVYTRPG